MKNDSNDDSNDNITEFTEKERLLQKLYIEVV